MSDMNKRIVKQARFLLQGLILSAALNIGLVLALFALFVNKAPSLFEHKPAEPSNQAMALADLRTHADVVQLFETLSFEQLIAKLESKTLIEDGFTERDLALGCLTACYYFNLEKALSKVPSEQRHFSVIKKNGIKHSEIILFPGLTDEDFTAIIHHAKTEQWPLTTKGLFLRIKHSDQEIPPSLAESFFLTQEFVAVETLLSGAEIKRDRLQLLSILREGDWQMLEEFSKKQREAQDLSVAHQQRFLLDYIGRGSKKAAEYMLQVHGAFAVKKLDDAHVIAMIQLLDTKTPRTEAFAKALLISPRSTSVWKLAAAKLYQFAGESMQEPYDHMKVLAHFIPAEVIKAKTQVAKAALNQSSVPAKPQVTKSITTTLKKKQLDSKPKPRTHIIQEGESLSVIAKKYKVSVEALKKANHLQSDNIRAGKSLQIP